MISHGVDDSILAITTDNKLVRLVDNVWKNITSSNPRSYVDVAMDGPVMVINPGGTIFTVTFDQNIQVRFKPNVLGQAG
jgi:hypothetical protein